MSYPRVLFPEDNPGIIQNLIVAIHPDNSPCLGVLIPFSSPCSVYVFHEDLSFFGNTTIKINHYLWDKRQIFGTNKIRDKKVPKP